MKHFYLVLFLLSTSINLYSQNEVVKLDNYSASNGMIYSEGDHFVLGKGSLPDGTFKYVSSGGWDEALYPLTEITDNNLDVTSALTESKIKRIRKFKNGHQSTVVFKIGVGTLTNYYINIEKAISTCEVQKCQSLDQRVMNAFEPVSASENDGVKSKGEKTVAEKKIEVPEEMFQTDFETENSIHGLDEANSINENQLIEVKTSSTRDAEQPKVKDDSLWPSDNKEKYVVLPIYAFFLSMGIISWMFYRKYRIQDGRFKTGYRMPNLGIRKMAGKVVYIIILTIVLTPIGYLLIYLGIF